MQEQDTKSILVEYRFLNCSSVFCHLFLRQSDNLSEIFRTELQNLKKISKKMCFLKILKYVLGKSKKKKKTLAIVFQDLKASNLLTVSDNSLTLRNC